FAELLEASRRDLLADFAHQHMPFELLVEAINPVRQLSYNPLFQIMLLWQNNERAELSLGEGLRFGEYALDRAVSKFDLTLTVNEDADGLSLYWRYATDLFTETSVRGWARSFECLLEAAVAEPQSRLGRLPVLGDAERAQVLGWHAPVAEQQSLESLPRRIERQAASTPDAVALVSGDRRWSYAALNARAEQVASRLRAEGVSRGAMVGVCCERHGDLVAALLGVLKAGAGYLPLDPGYPAERLRYMVADSGTR
ncbi:AMP-binding protein, partial [Lysobacter brunescens]